MKIFCLRDSDVADLLAVLHVHRRDGWEVADRLLYLVNHQNDDPVLGGDAARTVIIEIEADGFALMARYDSRAAADAAWDAAARDQEEIEFWPTAP